MFKKRLLSLFSRYGLGFGKGLKVDDGIAKLSLNKLHLGCGHTHIKGWCNVDIMQTGAVDLICDVTSLPGFPSSVASEIYSCHVLEHFSTSEVPSILSRWFEILAPGGALRISVPDLDAITKIYQANLAHFQVPGNQPWIALIYGGQKDMYDFHKTGFNFCYLKYILQKIGFVNIETYPHSPHFIPGFIDNSMATEPFGEYISLNVIAIKPAR